MLRKVNVNKLFFETDFIDRFLGFLETYDNTYDTSYYKVMQEHIDKEDFRHIRSFLKRNCSLTPISFPVHKFISMSIGEFIYYQENVSKISALSDECKVLYKEFITFYE